MTVFVRNLQIPIGAICYFDGFILGAHVLPVRESAGSMLLQGDEVRG